MSIVFKQDGVNSLVLEVNGVANTVNTGLTSIKEASDGIVNHEGWQGNKATAVKEYFSSIHGAIIASLGLLMKDLYDQTMLYQDGYYAIDGDAHAVILETELEDMKTRLTQTAPIFDGLSAEAEKIVRSVAHIGSVPYSGIQGFPEGIEALAGKLGALCEDIRSCEADFQGRFEAEHDLISSIRGVLAEARGYKLESFSSSALANSENYKNLATAYQALATIIESNAEAVEHAEKSFQETYKVLEAEYQERLEKAKRAKFWTGVITAVASAVVIAATGGAGIAVVALVGAASGAINAGVGSYYDQQVGSVGYPGTVNGWEVAGASLFGGIVGAASSCVGFGASSLSSGANFVTKMVIEGGKSVATGMIERAGDACYDSIVAGEPVLDIVKNSWNAATDYKEMVGDFTGGCIGGAISQGFEAVADKAGGKLFPRETMKQSKYDLASQVTKAPSKSTGQIVFDITKSTGKDTVKGIGKRFGKEYITSDANFNSALSEAFDLEKIKTDVVYSAASSAGSEIGQKINEARQQKKLDSIQKDIDEEARKFNERNEAVCEKEGIPRGEDGHPLFDNIAEVEIEETYVDPEDMKDVKNPKAAADSRARYQDGKNSFNAAVEAGLLDKDTYKCVGTSVTNIKTGEKYTWDHGSYDVNTGKTTMRLVPSELHDGIKHQGGDAQIRSAYNNHGAGKVLNNYNNASRSRNVSAGKTGSQSGSKITSKKGKNADATPPEFGEYMNYQFVPVGG